MLKTRTSGQKRRIRLQIPAIFLGLLTPLLFTQQAWSQDTNAADTTKSAKKDADASKEAQAEAEESSVSTGLTLQERIRAVSNPVFAKEGRFGASPFLGFSINDPFFERLQVGARGNYHLFEWLSLEAGGAINYLSVPLPTVRMLAGSPPAITDVNPLLGYFDASASFSPIYGKTSILSEWVLHFDAFVTGGIGAVATLPSTGFAIAPAASFGFGANFVALEWLTVRVELRDYIYPSGVGSESTAAFGGAKIQNLLFLNLGVGFFFPFEVAREDIGVVKVSK